MLTLLLLTVLCEDGLAVITDPLFPYLSCATATVSPDGSLYILDAMECQIHPFAPNGKPGTPFGRKGQGPGELEWGHSLQWFNGQLLASGGRHLNLFKPDGSFMRSGGAESGPSYQLTVAGAISGSHLYGNSFAPEKASVWALGKDLDASKRKELFQYPRPPMNSTSTAVMTATTMTFNFCPVSDNFFLTGTADGKWVQLYHAQASAIRIFDGTKNQQVGEIKLAPGPIPAQAWVDEQLEKQRSRQSKGRKFEVVPQIPERCPRLRLMKVIGDQLYVVLWSTSPDKLQPVQAYTPDGKPSKPRFSGKTVSRIIGVFGDRAWIILKNEDEDMNVPALVPLAQLEKAVADQTFLDP